MNDPLRKCPTCMTPVADAKLGLRDFRWVVKSLPGRVAPMDIDFALEKNGRFLFIEFKPLNAGGLSVGSRILYKTLVRAGHDVWLVRGDGPVEAGPMDRNGNVNFTAQMSVEDLAQRVRAWFDGVGEER